jgi:hypothetical protein
MKVILLNYDINSLHVKEAETDQEEEPKCLRSTGISGMLLTVLLEFFLEILETAVAN